MNAIFNARTFAVLTLAAFLSSVFYAKLGLNYMDESIGEGLIPWIAFPMSIGSAILAMCCAKFAAILHADE